MGVCCKNAKTKIKTHLCSLIPNISQIHQYIQILLKMSCLGSKEEKYYVCERGDCQGNEGGGGMWQGLVASWQATSEVLNRGKSSESRKYERYDMPKHIGGVWKVRERGREEGGRIEVVEEEQVTGAETGISVQLDH